MFQLKVLLALMVSSCYLLTIVRSACFIDYPKNVEAVPRYEKNIGKYKLQLPYNGNTLRMEDKDVISGFCETEFSPIYCNIQTYQNWNGGYVKNKQSVKDLKTLTLSCKEGKLYYDGKELESSTLECAKRQWSIYATNYSHSWCEKNQNSTTLLLGTKSTVNQHILAGICYNFEQLLLQTVNYNVTYSQRNPMEMLMNMRKSDIKSNQTMTDDLDSFRTTKTSDLSDQILQKQLAKMSETNSWLHLANFEIASIVQGDSYDNYFKEYENILNVIWWHNLRLGNWKRFMNTLENYAYNNSFELFTGTSDVVRFPMDPICQKDNLLEIMVGVKNETIPGYIWTYLKSNDDSNQDFVVVGYNSPYAEFFSLENVIFCPDICSEISWLSEIQSYFRYASAGIMFCCSTDFMRQTNHLSGFPMDVLLTRPLDHKSTTEEATDTSVIPAINNIEEMTINSNVEQH